MSISSRTPEGFPERCPLCGSSARLDFSSAAADAPCPRCGYLIWKSHAHLVQMKQLLGRLSEDLDSVQAEMLLDDVVHDSLDIVELVVAIEEEFDIEIPAVEYDRFRTVGDVIRYLLREPGGAGEV